MKLLRSKPLCGLLNLHKPTGMTSRSALDFVAKPLKGLKVGHAGTLDPLASGVLVVAVGAATRLISYVQDSMKTYQTVVRLGATSNTLDADGDITERADPMIPTLSQIEKAVVGQLGVISQIPPQFSALKVEGRRAYDLARAGTVVELAARDVRIDRIEIIGYTWPRLTLEIDCGGGTYIRSIARDLGEVLGCGGVVEVLIRTRIGPFHIETALDPCTLAPQSIADHLLPALAALGQLPSVSIDEAQRLELLQGRPLRLDQVSGRGEVSLVGPDGLLVAVGEWSQDGLIWPRKVLSGS